MAIDSGNAIKNNKIDIYLGENKYKECIEFGITRAYVEKIEEDQ
jgi:3D (Asp-Asp-Asp) domain-containing protein